MYHEKEHALVLWLSNMQTAGIAVPELKFAVLLLESFTLETKYGI